MLKAWRDIVAIARAPHLSRWRILDGYFRVFINARLRWFMRRLLPPAVRIFGLSVRFADYAALRHLYREIFIVQHYAFDAPTPTPNIIDGGANIGLSAVYFKLLYPRAHLDVYEADVVAFTLLEQNLTQRGIDGITLHFAALGNCTGERTFYHDPAVPGGLVQSLVRNRVQTRLRAQSRVPGVRLSQHLGEQVDLIKLDLEGGEVEVLDDLVQHGALEQARQLIIEYHHNIAGDSARLAHFLGTLEGHGFRYNLVADQPSVRGGFQDLLIYAIRIDNNRSDSDSGSCPETTASP